MFERRIVPMYVAVCAVALAVWSGLSPGVGPTLTFGWTVAGMFGLYLLTMLLDHLARLPRQVPQAAGHATEVEPAGIAAHLPSPADANDPRR